MKTITEQLKAYDMLPEGSRVLCALSGGADSMCLLHWLCTNAEKLGIEVFAAHLNHGIRGAEADRDMEFVTEQCERLGVALVCEKADVLSYAERSGMGTEEAARLIRYEFLEKTADSLDCGIIATAHNSDDNAETVLLNLVRGSGTRGLCGIPPVRGRLIRPLLFTSRAEIEAYCMENSVPFVTDSTNLSDEYTRNFVRHRVMPALRELNPSASETILRSSELLRSDDEYLSGLAEDFIKDNYKDGSVQAKKLSELPYPVKARVLRILCGRSLTQKNTADLLKLANMDRLAHTDIHGMRVSLDRGRLYFNAESRGFADTELNIGERLVIGDYEVSTQSLTEVPAEMKSIHNLDFNCDAICGKISFTSRRDGDKIRLNGRKCTKSLKELFREAGMTQSERDSTPVLRDENGIIAVYGFGVAEHCAAGKDGKILRIRIKEKNNSGEI